jgi:hypothetical protein
MLTNLFRTLTVKRTRTVSGWQGKSNCCVTTMNDQQKRILLGCRSSFRVIYNCDKRPTVTRYGGPPAPSVVCDNCDCTIPTSRIFTLIVTLTVKTKSTHSHSKDKEYSQSQSFVVDGNSSFCALPTPARVNLSSVDSKRSHPYTITQ